MAPGAAGNLNNSPRIVHGLPWRKEKGEPCGLSDRVLEARFRGSKPTLSQKCYGWVIRIEDYIGDTSEYEKKEHLERRRPRSWIKSVSAFANSDGGTLIFGIADDGKLTGLLDAHGDADL